MSMIYSRKVEVFFKKKYVLDLAKQYADRGL